MRTLSLPLPLSRGARRRFCVAALAVALGLLGPALISPAGAPARGTIARRGACPRAKHASHAAKGGRCIKRAAHHGRQVAHQPAKHGHPVKKGSHKGTATPPGTPALCEDGSAPIRNAEGFTCRDGSEPACEDGGEVLSGAGGSPVCQVAPLQPGETGAECDPEGECPSGEFGCEGTLESGEAPLGCEATGGGEAAG